MEDIKNLILDKTKERFSRFGYKKTTLDELCHDCRISKKTIYEHFDNKEDLFNSLIVREIYMVHQRFISTINEISDPLEKLIQFSKIAIAFFNEDSFLPRLYNDETLFSSLISNKYDAAIKADFTSIITNIICEGKKQGQFRDIDEGAIADVVVRLFQAFVKPTAFSQEKASSDDRIDVLVDLIVNALLKK